MADRYLRGTGARNWNDTANWSDTSGGAGGFSVPTSGDNVIFDANSGTGTITVNAIANMLDFTCSNIGALTISNAAYAFNVYGSLTLHTSLTVTFTSTGYLYMKATDSRTITTNGKVANWNRMYFDGVGGVWTNQDDMNTLTGQPIIITGTWVTNNFTINTLETINISGNLSKSMFLGSSHIYCRSFYGSPTNFTFNAGTSTVYFNTIYNSTIYSALTYYNLQLIKPSAQNATISVEQSITILNNLTIIGYNDSNARCLIASNTIGATRTITCNGTVTASNVDFRDIKLAGTCNKDLSAITGGSGDCGGNSGITFTPAQTQYYKHTSGACSWSDSTKWFSDQAKTIAGRVPLPQDDATFDATSFTGSSTLSVNCPRIGGLDMSGVNQAVIFNLAYALECYGSYVLGANITQNGNYNLSMYGVGNLFINTYNRPIYSLTIYVSSSVTSLSNLDVQNFILYKGIFDLNDYNIKTGLFSGGAANINCTVYLGNGIIETSFYNLGQSYWFYANNRCNLYAENSTVLVNTNAIFGNSNIISNLGNGKIFNKIHFSGSHTGNFDIAGSNTIAELIIEEGKKVRFTAATNTTIGKLTAIGTEASPITITSVTAAQHTLTKSGVGVNEIKYCNISYSNAVGGFTAENSVDGGNNTGWQFITGYKMYIGALQVQKLYLGSTLITTAFLGNTQLK